MREIECVVDWIMSSNNLFMKDPGVLRQVNALLEAAITGNGSTPIRDAAEAALFKFLNHAGNFPPRSGISILTSQLLETDDGRNSSRDPADQLYFLHNNSSVVSLVPLAGSASIDGADTGSKDSNESSSLLEPSSAARLIVRDASGKYGWDAYPVYAYPSHSIRTARIPVAQQSASPITEDLIDKTGGKTSEEPAISQSPHGPPTFDPSQLDDKLNHLLN